MRNYRNKPVLTGHDLLPLTGAAFYAAMKAIGISPHLPKNGFYTAVLAKELAKTSNRKSAAYKKAYGIVQARCQYLRKKGLLINMRYGVWAYVMPNE
jgi:hypothetical protein